MKRIIGVVLAVLLVAGVVAIVIAFGGAIAKQFKGAGEAVQGRTNTAKGTLEAARTDFNTDAGTAQDLQNQINGGEFHPTDE